MVWFHSIPIFKLEVYNEQLGRYIRETPYGMHYNYECGFEAFFEQLPHHEIYQRRLFGKSVWEIQRDLINSPTWKHDFVIGQIEGAQKLIEFCIQNEWINSEWLKYFEWWAYNRKKILRSSSIFKKFIPFASPYIYRGIPPKGYRDLLRYGNTTAKSKSEEFKDLGLTSEDYTYAADNLPKAWEYARNYNPSIIVIYRKKYFYNLAKASRFVSYGEYTWARKDKSIDFRDTIVAIISVRYR